MIGVVTIKEWSKSAILFYGVVVVYEQHRHGLHIPSLLQLVGQFSVPHFLRPPIAPETLER